ncbi:MAG TPA: metallophosphoesterase family protein [Pyrinomonadaceae bacterium]|nr:metallophosphoesterase family protein [Pyrinomonadaceae bacterium]
MSAPTAVRIGVISDTHGRLDEQVLNLFAGVSRIIHAGDIGNEDLIWQLERVAPVIAVRGNIDSDTMCFPNERMAVIEGRTFYVRHQFATVEKMSAAQQRVIEQRMPDVVVFGHSHQAYAGQWRGTLLFNPGSAGPKRFNLPRSVGLLELGAEQITSRIIELDNPAS